MKEFLDQSFERLLERTDLRSKRYLYHRFKMDRLVGLVGPRGVGKTTMLLQYIKEHLYHDQRTYYFSADSVYFSQSSLLEFINELYLTEGYRIFFVDEIHKYQNWNQELKNLYDSFPDIQVIFSGSSMLDLVKGSYDLSRRATLYRLPGLSFREYLNFVTGKQHEAIPFKSLLNQTKKYSELGSIEKLKGHFKQYLLKGYYPFVLDNPEDYYERVVRVIEKTIYEDIANFYNLKTPNLVIFKKILGFLASIPPGEVNTNNIAKNLGIAHQTIEHYLSLLESVGMVRMMYPFEGGNQYLRKPQKIFLPNTNIFYALQHFVGQPLNKGTMREIYFLQALGDAGIDVFYSKNADYQSDQYLFEIGGKNKSRRQLSGSSLKGIVIKDDILLPAKGVIPLLYFGFLY